jgi:macrolide-specific efflux system membrane fusion protein
MKAFIQRLLRRKKLIILIVLIVGVLLFVRFKFLKKDTPETAIVSRRDVVEEMILSGEIEAVEHAKLTFGSSGELVWIGVKTGDQVVKGQALAKIDTVSLNASYQRARADLRAAEASVDKIHDDVKDHSKDETFTQKDTRTTAEVTKDKAYEAVIIAEKALKDSTLKAPFAGTVTYVANPFPGINTLATQTQVELLNVDTVYFKVLADQTEVVNLKVGQKTKITLDSLDGEEISGTITETSFVPDPEETSVVYEVKVAFDNFKDIEDFYRLGMSGDAAFQLSEAANVIAVPSGFIKTDKDGKYVLTENGKKRVAVEVGLEGEDFVEIKSDLAEGTVIYD